MGYRNYLYIADKKKINKVHKMSANELWELVGGKTELDEDIDTPWIGDVLDKLNAEEFIELGKYLDYTNEIQPFLKPLFRDKLVHNDYNCETECMLVKPEILQKIATIFKEKVKGYYKSLLEEKSSNVLDTRPQLERCIEDIRTKLTWLENSDTLPSNKWNIIDTWLYEYEMFNILHLMRIFNPKKQALIWIGH